MALGGDTQRRVGQLYLAFVRTRQGRAAEALDLLDNCRDVFRRTGQAWEQAASWLLSAWALIALGETARGKAACDEALRLLKPLGDQGPQPRRRHPRRTRTGPAKVCRRHHHLRRAADATHRLGFAAAEAHHLTNLGRAQEQDGDPSAAIATYAHAIETAHATGVLRTAALASARLGRTLRFADSIAARAAAGWSRQCLQGILFVLHTGIGWEDLPQELGFGSGMTCWRRLQRWTEAGVFDQAHQILLAKLNAANRIDWSRAAMDGSHIDAKKGVPAQARRRSTGTSPAASTI